MVSGVKKKRGMGKAVFLVLMVLAASPVLASNNAIIKHRQAVMDAVGGHFSALFAVANMSGLEQYADQQAFHIQSLVSLSRLAEQGFPAGTDQGKTKARAAIWEQPAEFKLAMEQFLSSVDAAAVAIDGGDDKQVKAALRDLGGSCKNCHDNFKAK